MLKWNLEFYATLAQNLEKNDWPMRLWIHFR